jgi:endoglucanase
VTVASTLALAVVLIVGAGWWIAKAVDPRLDAGDIARMREDAARVAGRAFLDEYVEPDGRVVRHDEAETS